MSERMSQAAPDPVQPTFTVYTPARAPDRAAALRDVETLLWRVECVHGLARDSTPFRVAGGQMDNDHLVSRADLAALIVDRVLGAEQDGERPC